jgi:hypothetical protein
VVVAQAVVEREHDGARIGLPAGESLLELGLRRDVPGALKVVELATEGVERQVPKMRRRQAPGPHVVVHHRLHDPYSGAGRLLR